MDKATQEIERMMLMGHFPKLRSDDKFVLTSPPTPDYNCIAWAFERSDRWMWPRTKDVPYELDGLYYWPDTAVHESPCVELFVGAFKSEGYEACGKDFSFEEGISKIALYVKSGTTVCVHAARQKADGTWTSKMGEYNDIQHSTPDEIAGGVYGELYCVMKKRLD